MPKVIEIERPAVTVSFTVFYLQYHLTPDYDPQDLPEVDHAGNPGATVPRQALLSRQGYRFANFLEGYIVVNAQGEVSESGFTGDSGLNFGPSFRGIQPQAFPTRQHATVASDRKSVRFVQLVGCRTQSPEVIGSRAAVRVVDSLLGIRPNWGGPMGVQAEQVGSNAGARAAELIRPFPPIWTELELVSRFDGSFQAALIRRSLFPSLSYYTQIYSFEPLTTNSTDYRQIQTYDARHAMDRWRADGWGSGNPWHMPDPRILGIDLPIRPDIPSE